MRTGTKEGLHDVYDEEAQLILADRERIYARRGLTLETYRRGFLQREPFLVPGLWYIYYTNQRVLGLRDPSLSPEEQTEERYAGTLRAIDRTRYLGPKVEDPVLEFFAFPLTEIAKVQKRGRRHLTLVVQDEAARYEFRFKPWGAACRFFSVLFRREGAD